MEEAKKGMALVDNAMDAQTWAIVIGVIVGFFALPGAMIAYDLRQQRRQRAQPGASAPDSAAPTNAALVPPPGQQVSERRKPERWPESPAHVARGIAPRRPGAARPPTPTDIDVPTSSHRV